MSPSSWVTSRENWVMRVVRSLSLVRWSLSRLLIARRRVSAAARLWSASALARRISSRDAPGLGGRGGACFCGGGGACPFALSGALSGVRLVAARRAWGRRGCEGDARFFVLHPRRSGIDLGGAPPRLDRPAHHQVGCHDS